MIAGVATGMADAFHIDVVVVRVIWVVAALASGGLAIPAYAVCWIAFPSDEHPAPMHEVRDRNFNLAAIAGLAALALGFVIVASHVLSVHPFRNGGLGIATVLIGGGLAILFLRHPDRERPDPEPDQDFGAPDHAPPTAPPAPAFAATETPAASETSDPSATATVDEPTTPAPAASPGTTTAWSQHSPWPAPPTRPPGPGWGRSHWPRPPRRPRRRSFLTPITLSILLIGAGVAALLDSVDAVHLTLAAVLASGLIVVGAALVLSAWFGRARGLIVIGLLLLLATIPATVIDVPISGGIGEREYRPIARTDLRRTYELGIGHLVVDLRNTPLSRRVTTITGSLGIGELDVDVPANVRVDVRAHAGAGATEIFGHLDDGVSHDTHRVAGAGQRGVLRLVLRVGAGSIHVRRWGPDGEFFTS
jgi:phage shock protein PspC (stress-responsive transcriptional regulator)